MIIQKIKENPLVTIIFTISTLLFLYQHSTTIVWDFSAYILNAQYLFYQGTYFEVYRAPIMPLLLGFFLIFKSLAPYLYIVFTSSLFLYSNIKLSGVIYKKYFSKYLIKKSTIFFLFYFFSLSPFVLKYGISTGTELLSLAFFELFLIFYIENKLSGHFLALAFLTRYNFLLFVPLLLLNKDYKKILKNFLIFFAMIFPWLLFNYIKFGNWFTSIVDSYALNIFNRSYLIQPFPFLAPFEVIGWFLPFFLIGIFIAIKEILKNKSIIKNKYTLLFFLIFLLILFDFKNTPLKIIRYLFALSLPIAFFSTIAAITIIKKYPKIQKYILAVLIIGFLISSSSLFLFQNQIKNNDDLFYDAAKDIKQLNLQNCRILSPHWVPVTYYTENVYPLGLNKIPQALENDKIILIFKNFTTIDDLFEKEYLENIPRFIDREKYFFLAKKGLTNETCMPRYVYNEPYTRNHCEIISKKFSKIKLEKLSLKICKLTNKN